MFYIFYGKIKEAQSDILILIGKKDENQDK